MRGGDLDRQGDGNGRNVLITISPLREIDSTIDSCVKYIFPRCGSDPVSIDHRIPSQLSRLS